jgi:hypothetical protein
MKRSDVVLMIRPVVLAAVGLGSAAGDVSEAAREAFYQRSPLG